MVAKADLEKIIDGMYNLLFPSPCGVMVAKVESGRRCIAGDTLIKFPSPCGVMVAKALRELQSELQKHQVSVPLRGNGCES